ncbi:hypothetical protein U5922_013545 [Aquicoccus sp. G2-2]|uniref:hypothetical protein n=1 Tax=Aquicoccus sp. G2-2 TaxID=3092120 RepID=UPI002ADFE783|nr:hypothetical protein [Aquicoccus sp. G2-2]MEA1114428.1 hypothetical protein [Aquicoccus sp. G2-2]
MTRLLLFPALLTGLLAGPALADLSVDDAWGVWKAQLRASGVQLEASETHEAGALQIGEMRLSMALPYELGRFYLRFDGPRFAPVDGGRVAVSFPPVMQASAGGEAKDEGSVALALELAGNINGVMSGTAEDAVTEWSSDGYDARLVDLAVTGEDAGTPEISGGVRLGPMSVRNTTKIADGQVTITQNAHYNDYVFTYRLSHPQAGKARTEMSGDASDVTVESKAVLPVGGVDLLGLARQLRDGLSLKSDATAKRSSSRQKVFMADKPLSSQSTEVEDYNLSVALSDAGLDYGGTTGAFNVDMDAPPVPHVNFGGAGVDARALLPLLKQADAQDAVLKIALNGLTMDDSLWDMFDPEGKLERDPVQLSVDLRAKVKVLFEFLDFRAMLERGARPSGGAVAVDQVTLNGMQVDGLGAKMTGSGEVALDNDDWTTFDGIPAPDGSGHFELTGVNGLIDTLISMGLVQTQEALGLRLMMNMVTRAGEGADTLVSDVEVKKTGEISANGQRLR